MPELTSPELSALRNLAAKRGGELTPFINIADAQRLTSLGLARRNRQCWSITVEGSRLLQRLGQKAANENSD